MKSFKEMTEQDYQQSLKYKYMTGYNPDELAGLFNLFHTYVNPNSTFCASCVQTISEQKREFYTWFNHHQKSIEENLEFNKLLAAEAQSKQTTPNKK